MRVTPLPIPDFLRLSIEAAETLRYAAVAVVIDRTADRTSRLLDELVEDRVSLDSVTDREILIVIPAAPNWPRSGAQEAGVADRKSVWDVYTAVGVALPVGVGVRFRQTFWDGAGPAEDWDATVDRRDAERAFTEHYLLDEETSRRIAVDITRSATVTAQFLGLGERYLPCLCILSLRDAQVFVFRYGQLDNLYSFFRRVMMSRPPHASKTSLWLSEALLAAAADSGLEADDPPDRAPYEFTGRTYRCYRPRRSSSAVLG